MNDSGSTGCCHSDLPELPPEHVLHHEWNTFRRELARLVEEGHQGKFALIKGQNVNGCV